MASRRFFVRVWQDAGEISAILRARVTIMCADECELRCKPHAQMVSARVYLRCAWCVRFACRKRFGKLALSAYYGQGIQSMPQVVWGAYAVGVL